MQKRKLRNLEVSALGFGCMSISANYGPAADKKKATPAQVALAWLLAQKPWIVPIPGTRRKDHLDENLGAINVQLTPSDLREIENAFSAIRVRGERMSEKYMESIDQS